MITDFKKYVKRTSRLYFAYVIHKGVIILSSAGLFKVMKSHKTNKKGLEITISNPSRMHGEHSISRVLYRLHGDDYLSSHPIAWMIKRRNPEGQRAASTLPYSVLLRMGFTKPAGLPSAGALLPHLSTLTTCVAVSFSMALSLGSLPPDVIRHPALRSSDFPHALRPAIIFPARVLQYSMETEFFQEKDKIWFRVKGRHAP